MSNSETDVENEGRVTLRLATEADLPRIVELIHLGAVGGKGAEELGPPLPERYYAAFRAFRDYPEAKVMVAELDGLVVGTLQFHMLPSLSAGAYPTAEVESVHVAEAFRGQRIGEAMMGWAIEEAQRVRLQAATTHVEQGAR